MSDGVGRGFDAQRLGRDGRKQTKGRFCPGCCKGPMNGCNLGSLSNGRDGCNLTSGSDWDLSTFFDLSDFKTRSFP